MGEFDADLALFRDVYLPNAENVPYHGKWARANPGEVAKWTAFRDAVLRGEQVSVPELATSYGKALVGAGRMHMTLSRVIGGVRPPGAVPVNVELPLIDTSQANPGQVLSATVGTWSGAATQYRVTWAAYDSAGTVRQGTVQGPQTLAGGETVTAHTVVTSVGQTLRLEVTASNATGSAQATSLAVPVVTAAPPPVVAPAYRTDMPPNQAAPTTSGFKGFLNCASNGANMPVASSLVTIANRRVIDTYSTPEWWFAWSMMFPSQAPWTTSGLGTWCVYPLNFHALGVSTAWGSGSGGGAGWGFAFVSPILMFESVADAPVGGNRPLDLALHQEDGQPHLNITMPFTLVHGTWHHFLVHIVFGLSSDARWSGVVNPSLGRRIGKVEIWKDNDIIAAPASPTWAMDPVGTLRAGVDPANSQRYCQRAIEIYEAQLYTPSYTESPLNPTSIISRANYRVVRCGQTLDACLAEVPSFTVITDASTWQGHVNKGGTGANLGNASRTVIADPGGYPR